MVIMERVPGSSYPTICPKGVPTVHLITSNACNKCLQNNQQHLDYNVLQADNKNKRVMVGVTEHMACNLRIIT